MTEGATHPPSYPPTHHTHQVVLRSCSMNARLHSPVALRAKTTLLVKLTTGMVDSSASRYDRRDVRAKAGPTGPVSTNKPASHR